MERYTFTDTKVIHKVDSEGKPDLNGLEFHLVSELSDGYMVYIKQTDPSQPSPNYFLHKRHFVEVKT